MEISNHWLKTPDLKTKRTIPDKFGYWFAKNLPEFFSGGVTLRQIAEVMQEDDGELWEEWCELNGIIHYDRNGRYFVGCYKKGGANEKQ
tara:strand:+ start:36 stop:302 length:267 start_codon:yes stop_codon:yes gene_type:complete